MIKHFFNNLISHIFPQSIHMILPIIHPPHLPRQSLRSNTRKHPPIPPILLFRRFLPQNQVLEPRAKLECLLGEKVRGSRGLTYRNVKGSVSDFLGRCVWLRFSFFDHKVSNMARSDRLIAPTFPIGQEREELQNTISTVGRRNNYHNYAQF